MKQIVAPTKHVPEKHVRTDKSSLATSPPSQAASIPGSDPESSELCAQKCLLASRRVAEEWRLEVLWFLAAEGPGGPPVRFRGASSFHWRKEKHVSFIGSIGCPVDRC